MSDLNEVQADIAQCNEIISLADSLETLKRSTAYKKVFAEGYLKSEAVRNTMLLDHAQHRELAIRALAGIASLQGYLDGLATMGRMAKDQLVELESERIKLSQEV